MENITDKLKSMIPQNLVLPLSDSEETNYLTDEEKKTIISHSIDVAKKNMLFRLVDKGMLPESAMTIVSQKDWENEIQTEEVIRGANMRKYYKLKQERQDEAERLLRKQAMAGLIAEWDAKKFYETMKAYFIARNGTFKGQDWNKDFIRAVCLYMAKDSRFESEMGYDFNKGLLITGTAGLGKTETIRAVANNPVNQIRIISILEIVDRVKETGECLIGNKTLLIDDIGTEPEYVNYYGTKINWFKDFIEGFYLRNTCFYGLMVTTNIDGQEIENRYGYRVRSRCKDMFNVIRLEGVDLRG